MGAILDFFSSLPGELYVFLISMLPIVELRGAIPIGASPLVGLPFYSNYLIAVLGNLLPVPFILFFVSKFLDFLSKFKFFRPMVNWLRRKADKHSSKVIKSEDKDAEGVEEAESNTSLDNLEPLSGKKPKKKMTLAMFFGLMLFVAIPLPATGAWTGALIAALFNFPKKRSLLAITLGVLISGVIMSLASYGVIGFLSILT